MTREQEILLKMAKKALSADTSSDLISRADAIEAVNKEIYHSQTDRKTVVAVLSALPSADAVSREEYEKIRNMVSTPFQVVLENYRELERKYSALSAEAVQGEWDVHEDIDGEYGICSVCGKDADFSHYGEAYNYCPNCGARMKGGDDE